MKLQRTKTPLSAGEGFKKRIMSFKQTLDVVIAEANMMET